MQMKSPLQNLDVIITIQNTHVFICIEMIGWVLVMFYFSPFTFVGTVLRLDDRVSCGCKLPHKYVFINRLHASFVGENKNVYLHFMSFLHIDMTQVVEFHTQMRQ